jgi:small conductance mechanosensitive channel
MMTRLASSVPGLVIALVVAILLLLVLRFIGLFFAEVARGETDLAGLPRELAKATSTVLRFVVVLLALVFLGPIITGSDSGALAELGQALLLGLVLAAVPLATNVLLGAQLLFERRVQVGQVVSVGKLTGEVERLDFLALALRLPDRRLANIPHLARLFQPVVTEVRKGEWTQTLTVSVRLPHADVQQALLGCLNEQGTGAEARLISLDLAQAVYRVSVLPNSDCKPEELLLQLGCALQAMALKEST